MPDYIPPPDEAPAYIPPPDMYIASTKKESNDIISGKIQLSATKPLTKGERTYRMARPFVAPVVETVGMIGGGVAAAPSGPVGMVAGAGLGYGAAKQLVKAGDYNLGGYEAPTFNDQLLDAGKDIIEGAAMETAGPYINKGVGYLAGGLKDAGVMAGKAFGGATAQLAERRAAKIAQQAASGSRIANVGDFISAIRNREVGQTAAQATAKLQSPAFQSLLERAGMRDPGAIAQIESLQAQESGNALRTLAPWETQTQGRQATELLQEVLNKRTTPMREAAIAGANSTGQLKGLSVALQASSPLHNPANAGNDLVEGSVTNFMEEIGKWTGSNSGVIDATALDAIRKNAVDAAIARLRPGVDATTQRKMASGVLSDIKPVIDNAIEKAGGVGWKQYLAEHSAGMQDISRIKLTGEALRLWETNKPEFVNLVRGNSPEAVEKILGPGQYDIAKALSDRELGVLGREAGKVETNQMVKDQANSGQQALVDIMDQNTWRARIPFMIDRNVTVANAALGQLEKLQNRKVMDQLAEAATNPAKLEALLSRVPPSARSAILNALKSGNMNLGVNQVAPSLMSIKASGAENDGRK